MFLKMNIITAAVDLLWLARCKIHSKKHILVLAKLPFVSWECPTVHLSTVHMHCCSSYSIGKDLVKLACNNHPMGPHSDWTLGQDTHMISTPTAHVLNMGRVLWLKDTCQLWFAVHWRQRCTIHFSLHEFNQ